MKKTGEKILEAFLRLLLALFAAMPLTVHYFNAAWIAFLMEKVFRYRVDVVRDNLAHSFPRKDREQLEDILHAFYRHLAHVIVEAIWFGGCRNVERLRRSRAVEIVNPEAVNSLYEKAPSVVLLLAHTGNWEMLSSILSCNFTGIPDYFTEESCCVSYLKQSSAIWDRIMRDNRLAPLNDRDAYDGYLESRSMVRYMYKHRDEKKFYNVITDQRPYFSAPDFVRVNFMHRETITMSAGAAVAHKFAMAVAYERMRIKPGGRGYTMEYIPICEDASLMSVEDIMKKYYACLEEDLNAQPANYLWTHRRWA